MPDATASGTDAGGAARSREHNQGNQGRTYTVDQKAAVLRIRKCSPTAFYDILDLESVKTSCSDADIKKAYRKQSLLTHPDKNGHEHADEAFKMVARAFGVLGDKEKRDMFDRSGNDPDSRFAGAQAQNPFAGFARGGGGGAGGRWEDELSPEELFARFFGGGMGGGPFGGGFGGPQFVFNFGGGPGVRVHQFGGARPRARPRDPQAQAQQQTQSHIQTLLGLLPILFFFIIPILSSLFAGGDGGGSGGGGLFSGSSTPGMVYDRPEAPFTEGRTTANLNIKYFVRPADIASYSKSKLKQLDRTAEVKIVRHMRNECDNEFVHKQRLRDDAQGWFFVDEAKLAVAEKYPTPSCDRLKSMGVAR